MILYPVLTTQEELIASIRPGVTSVDSLYRDMQALLGKHLQSVGLIERDAQYLLARVHEFCPHHVSHHLGNSQSEIRLRLTDQSQGWTSMTAGGWTRSGPWNLGW